MAIIALSDVLTLCPVDGCIRQLGTEKMMRAHLADHAAGRIQGFAYERIACELCGRWFKGEPAVARHRALNKRCA